MMGFGQGDDATTMRIVGVLLLVASLENSSNSPPKLIHIIKIDLREHNMMN